MVATTNLGLPLMSAGQSQKHVTHNDALVSLDSVVQLAVKGRTTTAPPGSPAEGDRWIVPTGATGAWAGQTNKVAVRQDGAWIFLTPKAGWIAFVENEGTVVYGGTDWLAQAVVTTNGAGLSFNIIEEEVTLSGASVNTSINIPSRSIVLAVSTRVTQAITGATSFDCGTAATGNLFGGTLSVSLGGTNIGVIGPAPYYTPTPVKLTANGANFTGGKVRVAICVMTFTAPTQ